MNLTLFDRGRAHPLVLPERITGRYLITSSDENGNPTELMAIEADNENWYLKSNKQAFLQDGNGEVIIKALLEPFKTYTIHQKGSKSSALLYVEPLNDESNQYTKHHVHKDVIHIGRSKDSQICFSNKLVSSHHCVIQYEGDGEAILQDTNSANGTYVNGIKVTEKQLEIGDVINIMGLKIIFNGRILSLNNPHKLILLDRHAFRPFEAELPVEDDEDELDDFATEEDDKELFFRSPRFKRDIKKAQIKIDPPPQQDNTDETPLMLMLGPSITMGMASLFTALFMLNNIMRRDGDIMTAMPMLVMSLSMLLGMILWPILTKKYEKKKRIEKENLRQEKYKEYLIEMREEINAEIKLQSEILHENHVTLNNCLNRIKKRDRTLWERVLGQNDFLKVRLGLGNIPLHAEIKYPEKKFTIEDDNLQEELYELADAPKILKDVPVTLSFFEEKVSGVIGERELVRNFVKGIILQLTALHSYDELKLVFIYDKKEQDIWKFVKWFPHVWDEGKSIRFIASDSNEIKELSSYFEKEIANRSALSESDLEDQIKQHYVVFSMSKELAPKAEMLNLILKEKKDIGFSLVTLYDDLAMLPKECTNVVELGHDISKIFDKDDISGTFTSFNPDIYMPEDAEDIAIELSNIQLSSSNEVYTLPDMITFLEMFGVNEIEHLNAPTRWKENNPTLTIETPIGVNTMGQPFKLDLHEKYHGPHGLVAGMTGSGKSEFIMTYILSLAVNYHPDEVAFILIDYKGGGMANAFLELPHLAGTITNLDGAAVKRSLISIQSELKRRQAIFSDASRKLNESNIDIYKYQKLYREGVVSEPLQHLFIISDEFAELKTQQPEFMEQLVSAARIGRSLGVHLILATQKPSGVVDDQIWSNSKFRASLKVQEKADSMEVIKRPDAAELSTTGRFYLQVGYNELFELGQSAWAGAPYYAGISTDKKKDTSITVIDNLGRVVKGAKIDRLKEVVKNPPKQIDEVTKYLAKLAKQENIKVKPLWLDPIPALIYIDELKKKYQFEATNRFDLNPVIGEYDDPANQRQVVMKLPLTQEGNTVVYGVSGSGKTTFLTTMIYSLMKEHTPEEVNLYLLDFSTETLNWFRQAPHVGDVMLSHEGEKINNLFKMLSSEVSKRKKLLSSYGGDFQTYNSRSGDVLPSIVVAIHNYSAFSEMYEEQEENIAYLTREGLRYGIYFVVTALNTGAIRYKLLQNFKQLYVLQLNDTNEYSSVLGNVDGVYPSKSKGRGIFKTDSVYEFQIAHISKEAKDMFSFITGFSEDYQKIWNKSGARRVPILPEHVDLAYVKDALNSNDDQLPIAVDKTTLQLTTFNFRKSYVNLVLSKDNDSSVPFIEGLMEVMNAHRKDEMVVLDPNQNYKDLSGDNIKYYGEASKLEEGIIYLFNTLVYRNNTTKDAQEAGEEAPVFERVTCIIDSYGDVAEHLSPDGKDKLKVFLEKGDSLNVHIIISESVDKISSVSIEAWFKKQVSLTDAIWVGNGIADQFTLKLSKITNDLYQEIPDGFGYILRKGKPNLVKLLTSSTTSQEVAIHG